MILYVEYQLWKELCQEEVLRDRDRGVRKINQHEQKEYITSYKTNNSWFLNILHSE